MAAVSLFPVRNKDTPKNSSRQHWRSTRIYYKHLNNIIPALASLTAQSPGGTLFLSPLGPIHMVMPIGFPMAFIASTANSASSTILKN